jgi:hypothetical protein
MKNVKLRLGAKFGLVLGALAALILIVGIAGLSGAGSVKSQANDVRTALNESEADGEVIAQLDELGGVVRFYTLTDDDQPVLKQKLHNRLAQLFNQTTSDLAKMRERYAHDPARLRLANQLSSSLAHL